MTKTGHRAMVGVAPDPRRLREGVGDVTGAALDMPPVVDGWYPNTIAEIVGGAVAGAFCGNCAGLAARTRRKPRRCFARTRLHTPRPPNLDGDSFTPHH